MQRQRHRAAAGLEDSGNVLIAESLQIAQCNDFGLPALHLQHLHPLGQKKIREFLSGARVGRDGDAVVGPVRLLLASRTLLHCIRSKLPSWKALDETCHGSCWQAGNTKRTSEALV